MDSKLIIDVEKESVNIALLEDGRLVELNKENRDENFTVGNIYLAKVKKVMPGLNAMFVDVGFKKEGFLHYLDLGNNFPTLNDFLRRLRSNGGRPLSMNKVQQKGELDKNGVVTDVLKKDDEVLVQIVKEPISTKGPRLTTDVSIAGRTLVLIPFASKISVSQKITSSEEKSRLKKAVAAVKPQNYGVIIRTVAEGRDEKELQQELLMLIKRWEDALGRIQKAKKTPTLVVEEVGRAEALLRDHLNHNYESIVVNDKSFYDEIKEFISVIEPSKTGIVKFFDDDLPIFDVYNITKQIKSAFGKVVPFYKGAYVVIEHTEAFHVVDVNSGIRLNSGNLQEDTAFEVNQHAVDEVARQMRLRDMGGIVVIDLIDMHNAEHKQQIYERMRNNMSIDSARHNVLPLSKFGLMQITRERVRPVMSIDTEENCPTCHGTGRIRSSILFVDMLENKIQYLVRGAHIRRFKLYVHPYVYAYIKQGLPSLKLKWRFRYGFGVRVLTDQSLSFLEYRFVDGDGSVIDMSEPAIEGK